MERRTGNPKGRPRKEIDQKQFESLCGLQCTIEEICFFFQVTDKTLSTWCKRQYGRSFSEIFAEKKALGKVSLRRAQMQAAIGGNTTMMIWLGRNLLGQTDKDRTETQAVEPVKVIIDV